MSLVTKLIVNNCPLHLRGNKCMSKNVGLVFTTRHVLKYSTVSVPLEEPDVHAKPFSEVPGFKRSPVFGSLPSFFRMLRRKDFDAAQIHVFWKNMYEEFGPIVQAHLPLNPPMVAIFRPEDIETLYRTTMSNPVRFSLSSLKKVRLEADNNYFNKKGGILAEDYEEWWRVRSRVQTPMMKPKNVQRFLEPMDEVALEFVDKISQLRDKNDEMPEDFLNEMYKWALESVGLVALNRRLGCFQDNLTPESMQIRLINAVNDVFRTINEVELGTHFWKLFPTKPFQEFKKSHDTFLELADSSIRETEEALKEKMKHSKDVEDLTLMEHLLQQEGLTRSDVVTLILDMIFAGIDTTSHAVSFALYCLAKNPEAQAKLHKELDAVLGSSKAPLTKTHMAQLSYMKCCVKESLRVIPLTLGVVRHLTKDTVLCGYKIPKNVNVLALMMISAGLERNFQRAGEFIPDRWSRDYPQGAINPFAILPFSHGSRMCIGRRIAEQEIYTLLARILQRYRVEYHYGNMEIKTALVTVPTKPLKFKFIERNHN